MLESRRRGLMSSKDKYVRFQDPEVERVLIANGVGSEEGITPEELAALTNIGTWFQGNTTITAFPELKASSVVNLVKSAFNGCISLTNIDITSLTTLNPRCFFNCTMLGGELNLPSLISVPEGAEEPAFHIGSQGQFYNTSITKILDLGQITSLGGIFYDRRDYGSLENLGVFEHCTSLTKVILPSTITTIGHWCFCDCSSLSDINIPSGLLNIGIMAFANTALAGKLNINNATLSIQNKAFENVTGLTGLLNYSHITTISPLAFLGCNNFCEELNLPNLSSMPDMWADNDGSVWGVATAGQFYNTKITKVLNLGTINSIGGTLGRHQDKGMHASICRGAFEHCVYLTDVILHPSLTTIGHDTFYECSELSNIDLEHVITIGRRAFYGCTSLYNGNIINAVTVMNSAFMNSGVTNLNSPLLSTIGFRAFKNSLLTGDLSLPSLTTLDVQTIDVWNTKISAQFMNTNISKVVNLGSISTLGSTGGNLDAGGTSSEGVFQGCALLNDVTLPSTLTLLGHRTFAACTLLKTLKCLATTPPTLGLEVFSNTPIASLASDAHIYVPASSVDAYKAASGWSTYASIIEAIPE